MQTIEYDNIIKNKDEVFQKDLHALRIVINFIKELK